MDNKENTFEFSYTAPTERERKEIESIRRKYEATLPSKEGKIERIKKLDKKVKTPPTAISLSLGIIGTLIFGLGMSLVLEFNQVILGIIFSAIGLLPTLVAYPAYNAILNRQKNKYSKEILTLSEELLNEKAD